MHCSKCRVEAPENLISLTTEWLCEQCGSSALHLLQELRLRYESPEPARYVYLSELSNNLDKVAEFFKTQIPLNNPFCSVTLCMPHAMRLVHGAYDGVYADKGAATAEEIQALIKLKPTSFIAFVEPSTQILE